MTVAKAWLDGGRILKCPWCSAKVGRLRDDGSIEHAHWNHWARLLEGRMVIPCPQCKAELEVATPDHD